MNEYMEKYSSIDSFSFYGPRNVGRELSEKWLKTK